MVLIEADGIDALGEKAATVGIDQPENAIVLGDTKEAASAEAVDDPSPLRSLQLLTPATDQDHELIARSRPGLLTYLNTIRRTPDYQCGSERRCLKSSGRDDVTGHR